MKIQASAVRAAMRARSAGRGAVRVPSAVASSSRPWRRYVASDAVTPASRAARQRLAPDARLEAPSPAAVAPVLPWAGTVRRVGPQRPRGDAAALPIARQSEVGLAARYRS